jgi:hypothetical protein
LRANGAQSNSEWASKEVRVKFSHPLARAGRFWRADSIDEGGHDVFVVVTTLELDSGHKKFKPAKVDKLREAAKDFVREQNTDAREILLVNPMKG